MKVISAGYSKTGTKTLNAALTELGYEVYDYLDHLWYHGEEWKKILTSGGSIEDFKRMYKDVDAVVDAPTFTFWEEIYQAFPEAKIILTTRDEESWFRSLQKQMDGSVVAFPTKCAMTLTPVGWKNAEHYQSLSQISLGIPPTSFWKPPILNETYVKQKYRRHNAYVLQNAPKDKLLVYNVAEGWKPLCEFLGKDVPDKPFPHKNVAGTKVEDLLEAHPFFQQMKKEFFVSMSVLLGMSLYGSYKLYKHIPWRGIWTFLAGVYKPTT